VAKEQGLRSRAAFKLTQINRKFPFLESCQHGVLDLCAAPGGWTQIAARTCPKQCPIIAVDILPIRALSPQVTTIIGDITTAKCHSDIKSALSGAIVDAVLHDGAPNIGAEYGKDAYEQNELAIHALKCACSHLRKGGMFLTKVYRSRDYQSLHWVLQQLFEEVQTIKPAASRSQSAEIFLVAQDYKRPAKLDPRLLDPKHVFSQVEEDTTGGQGAAARTVFDKDWNKQRKQRGGYDMDHLDFSMRHTSSVQEFVQIPSLKTAIELLSSSTGLAFTCEQCRTTDDGKQQEKEECACDFFLHHPYTTPEVKESVSDLQVLNQSDFKRLLTWRTKLQEAMKARNEDDVVADDEMDADDEEPVEQRDPNASDDEDAIQKEIADLRQRREREKKRQKKRERALAAKRRRKAAMDVMAIDIPEHDKVFSLATLASKGDLEAAAHIDLDHMTDEQIFGAESEDDEQEDAEIDEADEETRTKRRETELEEAYNLYLQSTKDGLAKSGTKMAKRSKKIQRQKMATEAEEDQEMSLVNHYSDYNARTYAQILQGPKDSDDDDDDDSSNEGDDDGFNAEPVTPEEHAQLAKRKKAQKEKAGSSNPLIHQFADTEPTSSKTARWFSNPLFASIGKAAEETIVRENQDYEDSSSDEASADDQDDSRKKKRKIGLDADEVLASMPKTDKQIRHEKRLKAMERDERRQARRAKHLGEDEADFELAPANYGGNGDDSEEEDLTHLSESQKKKMLEARELIKAGMGRQEDDGKKGIEIVSAEDTEGDRPLPVLDHRNYDEGYDSDDYAQTLALGTMMLRRSKEKALVDASYNRYAWNDPGDLPEWFVDDENKHHRPQLPIPPALIAKMKEKMMALSVKPIKKVAEARARKGKRAKTKLAAAKKQAEAVARSSTEMSESMKLKAISKALRGQDARKPSKAYVVAKKSGNSTVKGSKLVDKRQKSDKRAMERKDKKKKKGKQNKLVGSKKRRLHS
jgi:AdoMet-dependent rRNA methyltransferase SPB1